MVRYSPIMLKGFPPRPVPRIAHLPPGRRSDSISVVWNRPSAPHHLIRWSGLVSASKIRSAEPLMMISLTIVSRASVRFISRPPRRNV